MENGKNFKVKLHSKRVRTEEKLRRLEQEGKAGVRYTATIPDIPFLIVGLICDIGWLIHMVAGVLYFYRYRFHIGKSMMCFLDVLAFAALVVVAFGVIMVLYMDRIHEKEIATRLQKNLSFGATIYGGLAAGVVGVLQLIEAGNLVIGETPYFIWGAAGGFLNFAFGLPIFVSFKKGIRYSAG